MANTTKPVDASNCRLGSDVRYSECDGGSDGQPYEVRNDYLQQYAIANPGYDQDTQGHVKYFELSYEGKMGATAYHYSDYRSVVRARRPITPVEADEFVRYVVFARKALQEVSATGYLDSAPRAFQLLSRSIEEMSVRRLTPSLARNATDIKDNTYENFRHADRHARFLHHQIRQIFEIDKAISELERSAAEGQNPNSNGLDESIREVRNTRDAAIRFFKMCGSAPKNPDVNWDESKPPLREIYDKYIARLEALRRPLTSR